GDRRGQNVLGVDVDLLLPVVLPGDDRAARSVGGEARVFLVTQAIRQGATVGRPGGIHEPRSQHVLGVDIVVDAAALIVPGYDGAAGAVRDHRGLTLRSRVGAQRT